MVFEDLESLAADGKIKDVRVEADFWKIVATHHGDKPTVNTALNCIKKHRPVLAKQLRKDFNDSLKNNIGLEDSADS
jgi:hypothetical protein